MSYPDAADPALVGKYPARAHAGGGLVWDEVLEYRVWCSPHNGAEDLAEGDDYYYAFATYDDALTARRAVAGAQDVLALVRQREYLDELEAGDYRHIKQERVTEWPVEFLARPRRDEHTITDFLVSDAPSNRLAILRGEAPRPQQ